MNLRFVNVYDTIQEIGDFISKPNYWIFKRQEVFWMEDLPAEVLTQAGGNKVGSRQKSHAELVSASFNSFKILRS